MKALVYHAKGGLANRLRALVGYRTLAKHRGARFFMHWELNGACGEDFHDLFERRGFEDLELIAADEMKQVAAAGGEVVSAGIWFADIWKREADGLIDQGRFYDESAAALRMLRPVPAIQERVERFAAERSIGESTGIHIRMTDNVAAYEWWARHEPDFNPAYASKLLGFENLIGQLHSRGEPVFLCTDNAEICRHLLAAYPNLFTYEKSFDARGLSSYLRRKKGYRSLATRLAERLRVIGRGSREQSWRTTPIADAVVDLFLLARCRHVVGTYYSSFAEVGAVIGSRPMSVIQGDKCVDHQAVCEMLGVLSREN